MGNKIWRGDWEVPFSVESSFSSSLIFDLSWWPFPFHILPVDLAVPYCYFLTEIN